ncbi:MAG: glycosyltransferase [Thermoproteota archaeon]|nr:glycosyltransferase [Thermoproteota archaeon]
MAIYFLNLSFEEYALTAILSLILASWAYLLIKALYSHLNTPVIRNSSRIIQDNFRFNQPSVSVIIPARNEEDNIESCLLSVLMQNYSNFEVVAVDDNSEDRTLEIMKYIKSKQEFSEKLKIISLPAKPEDWMGKTWASQQGYMNSAGDILLFTDADSLFESRHTIELTVGQMLLDKLDTFTGVGYPPLIDFWSKVVMPVWNLFSVIFDRGIAEDNDPESNVAFVMGSFFMIRRVVFEEIGTFQAVRSEIQEDRAFGSLLKRSHYRMKMFKIDSLVSALWSRDLSTLWHGIHRTLRPALLKSKSTVISQQLILFAMIIVPFLLLPYNTAALVLSNSSGYNEPPSVVSAIDGGSQILSSELSSVLQQQQIQKSVLTYDISLTPSNKEQAPQLPSTIFWLNMSLCLLIIAATGIKGIMKYRLVPLYSVLCFLGGLFLIAAYTCSIFPVITRINVKSIQWRGRPVNGAAHHNRKREMS